MPAPRAKQLNSESSATTSTTFEPAGEEDDCQPKTGRTGSTPRTLSSTTPLNRPAKSAGGKTSLTMSAPTRFQKFLADSATMLGDPGLQNGRRDLRRYTTTAVEDDHDHNKTLLATGATGAKDHAAENIFGRTGTATPTGHGRHARHDRRPYRRRGTPQRSDVV